MIYSKTVFVLGAGASIPYGLLSTGSISNQIREMEKGPPAAVAEYLSLVYNSPRKAREEWRGFQHAFSNSSQPSIDAFLQHQSKYEAPGKAILTYLLLSNEVPKKVTTYAPSLWYGSLLDAMQPEGEKYTVRDYASNRVSVVTFNYDRSLEFFLRETLLNRFETTESEVHQVLSTFPVVHAYGSLGSIEPRRHPSQPFGNEVTAARLIDAMPSIHIIPENRDDSDAFVTARQFLADAEYIFILGFGFDPINVRRLHLGVRGKHLKRMVATCLNMTPVQRERAQGMVSSIEWTTPQHDCSRFMEEYMNLVTVKA